MSRPQGGRTTGSKSSNPIRRSRFVAIAEFGPRLRTLPDTSKSRNLGMRLIKQMWDAALPAYE